MGHYDLSLLLSINDAIATIKSRDELFKKIFKQLYDLLNFRIGGIVLLDKSKTFWEFFMGSIEGINELDDPMSFHKKIPIENAPFNLLTDTHEIIYQDRISIQELITDSPLRKELNERLEKYNINSFLYIPMMTGGEFIGYLVLSFSEQGFEKDNDFFQKVANLIAAVVSNARAFDELKIREQEQEMRLKLTNVLVNIKERDELLSACVKEMSNFIPPNEYVAVHVNRDLPKENINICFYKDKNSSIFILPTDHDYTQPLTILNLFLSTKNNKNYQEISGENFSKLANQSVYFSDIKEKYNIQSILVFKQVSPDKSENIFIIGQPYSSFRSIELDFIVSSLTQVSTILNNYLAYEEINLLKKQLEQEKNYLLHEISSTSNSQKIIGESPVMQNVLIKVKQVAPLDATVLIQGETGTGKDLIAQAIHNISHRKDRALIKINCAALPAQLIESELFGHEKGSFTGALERRIGKFEMANRGTIFLDEIGELPLELQAKLLRVIQEKEFERVGGKSTIHTNVRIIAATNRNLEAEVDSGKFRADLFFRLNVFPINVPPLRQRIEDIPLFINYFVEKYSKLMGKKVKAIKNSDLEMFLHYSWPGNIRELEYIIERAIIVSNDVNLEFTDFMIDQSLKKSIDISSFKSLVDLEREHILTALKLCKGKITGENSASKLLGINGKTLGSKMRKLGIKKEIVITI